MYVGRVKRWANECSPSSSANQTNAKNPRTSSIIHAPVIPSTQKPKMAVATMNAIPSLFMTSPEIFWGNEKGPESFRPSPVPRSEFALPATATSRRLRLSLPLRGGTLGCAALGGRLSLRLVLASRRTPAPLRSLLSLRTALGSGLALALRRGLRRLLRRGLLRLRLGISVVRARAVLDPVLGLLVLAGLNREAPVGLRDAIPQKVLGLALVPAGTVCLLPGDELPEVGEKVLENLLPLATEFPQSADDEVGSRTLARIPALRLAVVDVSEDEAPRVVVSSGPPLRLCAPLLGLGRYGLARRHLAGTPTRCLRSRNLLRGLLRARLGLGLRLRLFHGRFSSRLLDGLLRRLLAPRAVAVVAVVVVLNDVLQLVRAGRATNHGGSDAEALRPLPECCECRHDAPFRCVWPSGLKASDRNPIRRLSECQARI